MNTIFTQAIVSNEILTEQQIVRDLCEIEVCLVGGGEVIFVGN